ncbi:MAG TPA: type VI secretion system protein TssA [Gammaproteobacteria bacterium]|nr:type VI secretion system protein TssA [Gammaproteobacteria bacterium]
MIDLTTLLSPVSEDAPCGQNLEYDPAFGELERAVQGTPAREMGGSIIPAVAPDWNNVGEQALVLFERTKDLRVAVPLAHAALQTQGLPAFASGLALIRRLVTDYWDDLHPELDKDDHDDPTLRMNSLLALNDRAEVVGSLSRCALIQSRAMGSVSLRNLRIAAGELTPGEEDGPEPLSQAQIEAAFLDGSLEDLESNAAAARQAVEELDGLSEYLSERAGFAAADLDALAAELRAIDAVLSDHLRRRQGNGAAAGAGAATASAGAGQAPTSAGQINTREDVVRLLDRICEYFEKNEPSSPVPLLLRRAKGLVAKDFMEILRDLTPDGVSQARLIAGANDDD